MSDAPQGGPAPMTNGSPADAHEHLPEIDLDNPPFPLTAIDREILATPAEEFHRTTWDELKGIIST